MRIELVAQGGPAGLSLAAAIKPVCVDARFDRLDVAVAYATVQGVRAIDRLIDRPVDRSRWILGLDDAITQPEAIAMLLDRAGATVRVAKLSPGRRFHPKLYRWWRSTDPSASALVVGSGNMTQRGLQHNAEAAVVAHAETENEAAQAAATFDQLWLLGHPPGEAELVAYRAAHALAKAERRKAAARSDAPADPAPDETVGEAIPTGRTSENTIALAVCRIAATAPGGTCSYGEARRLVPRMIALTPGDLARSNSQANARWVQVLRNIQSNSGGGTNFIAQGYLQHVPGVGYRVTAAGRALVAG